MANYSLPSWIETSPDAVAKNFVTGLQVGAQLGEARNKLAASQQQAAMETQVKQQQLEANTLQQAQELQVSKAYKDQQIALQQQQVEAAQQKVALATAQAARTFQAQQSYQKDYQSALDMGLPEEDAARGAMFKNISMFGSSSGGAGMAQAMKLNNRGATPTSTVLTDSSGRPHTLAQIPGSLAFTDLDRGGGASGDWQQRHDLTRSERLQDNQTRMLERQRDAAQKALDALDEVGAGESQNKLTRANYDRQKNRLDSIDAQLNRLMGGDQSSLGGDGQPSSHEPAEPSQEKPFQFASPPRLVGGSAPAAAASAPAAVQQGSVSPWPATAFMGQGVVPKGGAPAAAPASPAAPAPAAPQQFSAVKFDKFTEAPDGRDRREGVSATEFYVPKLSSAALLEAAKKLGVAANLELKDDGNFLSYKKGEWGSKEVSRKKLEKQVRDAASEQQTVILGQ